MELPAGEPGVRTLVGEGGEALESGEEVGKEGVEKRVLGPVGRIGDVGDGGVEGSELGVEGGPPSDEGSDGEG